ncbi:MAG: two-component regulator propeller domain-containing protein [Bacteroides sp.]
MKTLYYMIFVLFLCTQQVRANHYYYKQISLQDGLPSTVRCIFTEKKGFIWIGTQAGLGRFDGHKLKRYIANPESPNALPHNYIYQITEDKEHNVWVLTEGGIARYQRQSDDFYIPLNTDNKRIVAQSACSTKEGIVFGASNKIYLYDYRTHSIRLLQAFKTKQNFAITLITPWSTDVLLCCNRWLGILLVNTRTGKTSLPPFNCGKDIKDILIDSKNRIWIAPYNSGVRCYNHKGKLLASYTTQNSKLSNNVILSIAEQGSHIWFGTDGGGINILHPETEKFSILEHIPGDNYSLPVNSILCLYNDDYNNMWAGSIRSGLINIREASIKTYTDAVLGSDRGLSDNTVLSLYQDSDDHQIWIGTDGGGINRFDPASGKFNHYPTTWRDKVASICGFSANELLVSLFAKGIFVFNKSTGKERPFTIVNKTINDQLCFSGRTVNLYRNTPETILLLADHVYRYTIASKRFDISSEEEGHTISGALLPITSKSNRTFLNDIRCIYELNHLDNKLKTLFSYTNDTLINTVSQDKQGNFWIGTNYGLSAYNPSTRAIKNYPNNLFGEVKSLICDRNGKLWIGSDGMLFSWLIKEQKFMIFGESDGVILNEYLQKPRLESAEGDIYMGGVKGLLRIDKQLSIDPSEVPLLQLTDVSLDGESVNNEVTGVQPEIEIPWDNKTITIRVMSQERDILRKKIYRYQIRGLNDQYIESYQPELVIRSLSPGTYQIMASCSTKDGDWTVAQQVLTVIVTPPWYKSWWFFLSCILLLSAVIIEAFRFTLKRKDDKMKWAISEHEQKVYEEKVRFLINISHELRTPLTLIHGPLQRILKSLPISDTHYAPLKSIYRQTSRMKELINMVLDLRKLEVNESKLQVSPQPLNSWIRFVAEGFVAEGEARGIHINYQLDDQIESVSFNADKCEIILNNLLINALKHSPEKATITLKSSLITSKQMVRISVIDQGCGLKQVDINQLFTRFYQGSEEQSGSGIGLSYSKILAELHGGSIGGVDNENVGATFFFELPLVTTAEIISCQPKAYLNELIADNGPSEETSEEKSNTQKQTILVVDDNPDLIAFLRDALLNEFKQVLTASDGVEALEVTIRQQPDLVISDVMMPRMNGYELCKRIKENIEISHIPIVLLTARDDQRSELQGYKKGADAYLTKPFEIDLLIEIIRSRLRNRENMRMRYLQAGLIPQPEESTISSTDEKFMLHLNKVITEHLESSLLDVTLLCKEMGMSRASLYNKMKALTNMGANDYINKLRMEKAMLLITQTNLSFTEIAEQLGFSTSRYFSTTFKQYTGDTPTQYKEKQKATHTTVTD